MRSSAKYRPSEISHVSTDDRFAVVANCYGDEAVAPSYVRFTELLSLVLSLFSSAGFENYIFAKMSGILDLSSDENAKHFFPRWFSDEPT
mgnify:CR=1 FL=1